MQLQRLANPSQKKIIHDAIFWLATKGEIHSRMDHVAEQDLTFNAIMHEVYVSQKRHPVLITELHILQFQRQLHIVRRRKVGSPPSSGVLRMLDAKINAIWQDGLPKPRPQVMMDIETLIGSGVGTGRMSSDHMQTGPQKIDVPVDANGMCYPKPNGGHRILPSIYTRIKKWWMRANGVTVEVQAMNDGHLENTMALLRESHGNVIAKSTELLGKMANHFHNDPHMVQVLESLCLRMQEVEVDVMYPIFKELADEATQRKGDPAMLVAINPAWFEDGALNWDDK